MLNLKVSMTVDTDGAFTPVARSRGDKAASKHILDWVAEHMGKARSGKFAIMHAMAQDRAGVLRQALEERYDITEMFVVPTGTAIATHTGTGIAVAFVPGE
jgi:fatty acid-binding protein DegV